MSEARLRVELCDVTRALFDRGHNAPMDGNSSVRLGDGFLVTPSATHKGRLSPSDLVRLGPDGAPVDPSQRASTELKLHLAVYAARPDVNAIVHAHSPHVVALSVVGESIPHVIPEAVAVLGDVALVPYATPTTEAVAEAAAALVKDHDVLVLERHGSVCLGKTLFEAYSRCEVAEHTARIVVLARGLGKVEALSAERVAALRGGG